MKKLILSAAFLSLACGAMAQPRPEGRGGEGKGMRPEGMQEMRESMKAEQEALKPLKRELRDAALKLKDLLEDEASDKDLQAGMDRVDKARKAIEARREKFEAEMKAKLPARERAMMLIRMAMQAAEGGMGQGGGMGMRGQGGQGAQQREQRMERRQQRRGQQGGGDEGWEEWTPRGGPEGQRPEGREEERPE